MKEINNEKGQFYRSWDEFEKYFFPKAYANKKLEERERQFQTSGTGLSLEIIFRIKNKLK